MKKDYIALTIGPIYKTLQHAKKTRELWAGSYLFSYIMRQLISKFQDRTFIIPYVSKNNEGENNQKFQGILEGGHEIGIFHDRFIFEAREGDFGKLEQEIKSILSDLSSDMIAAINKKRRIHKEVQHDVSNEFREKVKKYIKQYFKLYFCKVEFDTKDPKEINREMNDYLDSLELQEKFVMEEKENYISEFLFGVRGSFLMEDAFGNDEKSRRFESIPEIAINGLQLNNEHIVSSDKYDKFFNDFERKDDAKKKDLQYDIYQDIKTEFKTEFEKLNLKLKKYHKYIAIVHADGDNMGDTIKELKGRQGATFNDLSKNLLEFSLDAKEEISNFGGVTIFAGGDDLLFFAPVVNTGKTVFDLIESIDNRFMELFSKFDDNPTLSFGVSISYYKFPLYESLEFSRNLLFEKAKSGNKNSVAFRVTKHSGQFFEGVYEKRTDEYNCMMKLLNIEQETKENNSEEKIILFTSMMHNLYACSTLVNEIARDENKLINFFENHFNESVHKAKENKDRLDQIKELINKVWLSEDARYKENNDQFKMNNIFAALRMSQFIRN